jgi:hypothetical protein
MQALMNPNSIAGANVSSAWKERDSKYMRSRVEATYAVNQEWNIDKDLGADAAARQVRGKYLNVRSKDGQDDSFEAESADDDLKHPFLIRVLVDGSVVHEHSEEVVDWAPPTSCLSEGEDDEEGGSRTVVTTERNVVIVWEFDEDARIYDLDNIGGKFARLTLDKEYSKGDRAPRPRKTTSTRSTSRMGAPLQHALGSQLRRPGPERGLPNG